MSYKELSAREAAEIILRAGDTAVVLHKNPDADTVGTGTALVKILGSLGKSAALACVDPIPERLKFIAEGIPHVDSFEGKTVISVDVASPEQMGAIREAFDTPAMMIDHHEVGTPFAPYYTIKGASSAAEVLFDIIDVLEEMGKIKLNKDLAEPLFAAISSDTGSFKYSSVKPKTMRIAARLLECGIDHAKIAHKLFSEKTRERLLAEGYAASHIKTALDGKIAYVTHAKPERDSVGASEEDFEGAVDVVRELRGAEVAFVVRQTDKGGIRASLRSVSVNVAGVASKFGGGGHALAAGCSPDADSAEAAAEMLLDELKKLF